MKNNIDDLLKKAMAPDMEPSAELNDKILNATATKKKKKPYSMITKVAAVVLGVALAAPVVTFAAEKIHDYIKMRDTYISDDSVAMGNPDYMVPEDTSTTEEEVTSTDLGIVEGTANDKWLRKQEKQLSNSVKNTFYYYADYKTAAEDSGLDNWFSVEYETNTGGYYAGDISHCVVDAGDYFSYDINGTLKYNDGFFYVSECKMEGNVAEDYAHTVPLNKPENAREYVNKAGNAFALVDDRKTMNDGVEMTKTVVIIRYGMYSGSLEFYNLSEEEIHEILDTITVSNDSYTSNTATDLDAN
ncbi:MAG: hypothetical protein IJO70_10640 [Lachnospiraceae bacterium]|nr:hypothetical protein [Lachnospiraceae bacterium]